MKLKNTLRYWGEELSPTGARVLRLGQRGQDPDSQMHERAQPCEAPAPGREKRESQ